MTKAVFVRAALDKALRSALSEGATCAILTFPSARAFLFLAFPQLRTTGTRQQTGLQCLTKISAGYRRNP